MNSTEVLSLVGLPQHPVLLSKIRIIYRIRVIRDSDGLSIQTPLPKNSIFPLTFPFIYATLKYVMLIEKRKPISVATKNVTLFANLFFSTTETHKKTPLNLYGDWVSSRSLMYTKCYTSVTFFEQNSSEIRTVSEFFSRKCCFRIIQF